MNDTLALTPLERFLRLFARVEGGEGTTALILVANIFLILLAYYLIKPVREGWLSVSVMQGFAKIEVKAYSAFAQSLALLLVLPVYAWLASKWTRIQLIVRVGGIFAVVLVMFWCCQRFSVPYAGVMFYIFVGIFSVTLVAQFWSFASDIYGEARGKRLFPLVAIGASAGAVVGSWIGEALLETGVNAYNLILVSLIPLAGAVLFAVFSDRRESGAGELSRRFEPAAPDGDSPYRLIARHRYLSAMAAMTILFSWVVASGDNILFGFIQETLEQRFAADLADPARYRELINAATTAFYGNLYFWINLIGLLLQAFIVSRILRYAGFGTLLMLTPLVSLAAYVSMLATPLLMVVKVMKIAENSSNYSVNNTARQVLWLPTTKEMLYQAKPTIDTLCVRIGDGCAALIVLLGTRVWNFSIMEFIAFNLVLIVLWLGVAGFLVRERQRFVG